MRPLSLPLLAVVLVTAWASPAAASQISACAESTYHPAEQPPFGGQPVPPLHPVESPDRSPPGYRLTAGQAIRIASANEVVEDERAESLGLTPRAFTDGPCRWQVSYYEDGNEVAQVALDDRTGAVIEAWRDQQVGSELARGYSGAVAQAVNAPYVWLPLCVLFLVPFFDPRRPFRVLHLDLLALLALGISLFFFNRADIDASVPLVYPVLAYVFARMLWIGLRPGTGSGPVVPRIRVRWLTLGAVLLACGRIALNVGDSRVIDVGVAGVIGADRITHGSELYEGDFGSGIDVRGDVYGPFNYLAYVPFEQAFPWSGDWGSVPAAHAAAIAFDLLTALGLLVLGRRLRAGPEGSRLGVALAFAWLAYPFTLYTMNANANDSLVAATIVGAMLALTIPAVRGVAVALGTAAKFGPAALAPLFATGTGERRWRSAAMFAVAFVLVTVLLFAPFIPDGGLRELYDRTLGYQASRSSPFSVWGLAPSIHFLQPIARVAAAVLAVGVALWPRRKSAVQVAALAAAVIIAVQVGATHWFYFYVVWFLPLVLVALFARQVAVERGGVHRRRELEG